jgi:RNA polymerase sigma-70 factor (ECF subfamily)
MKDACCDALTHSPLFDAEQEISGIEVARQSLRYSGADDKNEVKSNMGATRVFQIQPAAFFRSAELAKRQRWPKKSRPRTSAAPFEMREAQQRMAHKVAYDGASLSSLFAREKARLYRTAFSVLRNKEDAEDALQMAMLSAYTNLSSFQGRSTLATWVTRIILNTALMTRRKQCVHAQLSLDEAIHDQRQTWATRLVDPRPDPEHSCALAETGKMVTTSMQELSPALRSTFQLRYIGDLSAFETAATESVKLSATKSRTWRARKQLARLLAAKGVNLWRGEIRMASRFPADVPGRRQTR